MRVIYCQSISFSDSYHILLPQDCGESDDQNDRDHCHNLPNDIIKRNSKHAISSSSGRRMSEDYHRSGAPRVLPIVHCYHPLQTIEGWRATNVNFTSLQHPDHAIEVAGIDAQIAPAVRAMDEELEIEHILHHSHHTEMQPMGGVQVRFVVMR